jgi:hypothetical protein
MKRATSAATAAFTLLFIASLPAAAQDRFHLFPQFADGGAPGGSYFRSTLTILPWSGAGTAFCEFVLQGMTANFEIGVSGSYFTANVPSGYTISAPTTGKQPLQTGFGVLSCSDYVYANVILTYYAADNSKISEATIFSTPAASVSRMTFDSRGGMRQAFAIANNSDFTRSYVISLAANGVTRSARVFVPARRNLPKFVDELLQVTPESIGLLTIQSDDYSWFNAVGFRFTGGVFTTIPAGN